MVIAMRELTSLSASSTTLLELQERPDASLVRTSSGESLNPMPGKARLSSNGIGEGKFNPAIKLEWANSPRVPVVDSRGVPLMPCTAVRARLLLKKGKATAKWNKLGIFYIRLKRTVEPNNQILVIGIDPGSKFEGISVVGRKETVLNIMSETVDWIKDAIKQRMYMRRARRYRNTRCRACRRDNRHSKGRIPPSIKARWDTKLRIINQLKKILPISHAVIEDIKTAAKKKFKKWNINFSPLEIGKQYFYSTLKNMELEVILKNGMETKAFRDSLGLKKIKNKSKRIFESQCVDSWCLASMVTGTRKILKSLYYAIPLRFHRRQLHRLEPERGGIRRRYGGTISLGIKKGTLVKCIKYGLCYIGGNLRHNFSLYDLKSGKRLTQHAKREDFIILTRLAFRTQFLSGSSS